ncbi:MAG: DeoR/GlpR transcriptional regulator [Clostridia bacterium]|nr:DeoR/GlpR transcriptional regulator [Clostridia bacterium]
MNKAEIREKEIMALLRVSGKVSVAEAMALLDVSESTVRRLFCKLETEGSVIRTYRGISIGAVPGTRESYSFERNELYRSNEKMQIGEAAEALIEEGDTLYLDSGTTVLKLCRAIAQKCVAADGKGAEKYATVTVFTNSLANLNLLKDYMNVCLIGGEFRPHRQDFCGYLTDEVIKRLHFSKCFVGADGFSVKGGLTASDFDTARINQLVVAASDRRILLADTSKAGKASVIHYAPIDSVDTLVTNKWLTSEVKAEILMANINIIEA